MLLAGIYDSNIEQRSCVNSFGLYNERCLFIQTKLINITKQQSYERI